MTIMRRRWFAALIVLAVLAGCSKSPAAGSETNEIRIPRGAGGVGFLPLLVMEKYGLIEKHAVEAGLPSLKVHWIDLGGPAVMNAALLSGSVDFIAAGPPAFLILWDRTRDSAKVMGVAAIASLPMYLNTGSEHLKKLDDIREGDKIAMTSIKVSIPAIIMQMYAAKKYGASEATRFDKYTVTMTHPDGVIALLSGGGAVTAHFTSPPFHQRERKDARIRTILTSDEVMGGSTTFTMLSTTSKFREQNPKAYKAVYQAMEEAVQRIEADKKTAADILLASASEGGFSRDEMADVIGGPDVKFTLVPEHILEYARFMKETGSIQNVPDSWKGFFFPESHGLPGS
jgi:NitT/TauT family transport system substrate-binding protein